MCGLKQSEEGNAFISKTEEARGMSADIGKLRAVMAVIFCAMLYGCCLVTLFVPEKEYSVMENRELQKKPAFTRKSFLNGKFQKQYEEYLSDSFFMRDGWVSLSVNLQHAAGKKDINGVYLGRDGYLLEKNDMEDTDYGQVRENVEHLSKFLNETADIYGEGNVSCIMIPAKALALPDKLPAFAEVKSHDDVLSSIEKKLSHPEILMDICGELQKHQNEYIYYRTDHHWTTLGAYYAYAAWANRGGRVKARPLEGYGREAVFDDFYGTTYNKVHLRVPADTVEIFHGSGEDGISVEMDDGEIKSGTMYFKEEAEQGFNRYNVFFSKNTFKIEVNTKSGSEKTLLVIKDSFANCFVPFLAKDYSRIIMIDYRYGKDPIGKIMGDYEDITDVLVLFNTEKFMVNTKLAKLADTKMESKTMEEFNIEDFLD